MTQAGKVGPIRAILFDKDGTLVDFQRTWGPAARAVMQHLAGGNRAAYDLLAAASRFVEADQRLWCALDRGARAAPSGRPERAK